MTSLVVAVLDTNVLVSALCLPASLPADLLRRWLAREFVLVLSPQILAELADILRRPKIVRRFAMTEERADAFAGVLRDLALIVLRDLALIVPGALAVEAVPGDPQDNHVVACAIEGEAGTIVSGDRHLRDLGEYRGIRVVSPAQFRALLEETADEAGQDGPER